MFTKKIKATVSNVFDKQGEDMSKKTELLVSKVINPEVSKSGYDFKVGTKYMLNDILFTVKERYEDSNTTQIRVYSLENGSEIYNLKSLIEDSNDDPTFKVINNV